MTAQCALATLVGTLDKHPEMKTTQTGIAVVNLTVKSVWEANGRTITSTNRAVLWREHAEKFMELKPNRGDLVEISGDLANKKNQDGTWGREINGKSAKILERLPSEHLPPAAPAESDSDLPF